jgi:RNA polymerase-binding transcription factor DksA
MSLGQRAHFRKMLSALKVELSRDIDRTVHEMQDDATVFADPNDRASQESDRNAASRSASSAWRRGRLRRCASTARRSTSSGRSRAASSRPSPA